MRTTLKLDDELVARAKAVAAMRGRSLTSLLEDALRAILEQEASSPIRATASLPVDQGSLRPGITLDDNAALRDLMDDIA